MPNDDLRDAALREQAQGYVHRYGGIVETLWPFLIALRDAARAEQADLIAERNALIEVAKAAKDHRTGACDVPHEALDAALARLDEVGRTG